MNGLLVDIAAGTRLPSPRATVEPDRLTANAVFPYSIQVGTPIDSDTSLASMARLHGEGVRTWWEGGTYHVTYRKDATDGRWTISRLEYRTLARADYRPGRTYAVPPRLPWRRPTGRRRTLPKQEQ